MNFYGFHIGDYASKTRHLSWDEDLAYRRLLDAYYTLEGPLPLDRRKIYRLVIASSAGQRRAVDDILAEFFTETADGFSNNRCEEVLQSYRAKAEKARASAEKRWGNAKQENSALPSHEDRNANASANAMRTHSEGNATITITNTITSKDIAGRGNAGAREPLAELESQLRKAAGWESEASPNLAVTGPIHALIEAGADLHLDVLPIVKALAPQARKRTSWRYFIDAIKAAQSDRIAAAKPINGSHRNDRTRTTSKPGITELVFATLAGGNGEGDAPVQPPRDGE